MINKDWELIRLANEKYLRIPPHISDYIAIQDILRLCTYGLDNKTISNRLEMTLGYVEDAIRHYFEHSGWEESLDFNPYFIYKRAKTKFGSYKDEIELVSVKSSFDFILASYMICKIYDNVTLTIDKYYQKEANK